MPISAPTSPSSASSRPSSRQRTSRWRAKTALAVGVPTLVGLLLVGLALLNERLVRAPLNAANAASTRNYAFTEMSMRNTEVIRAMAMADGLMARWKDRGEGFGFSLRI